MSTSSITTSTVNGTTRITGLASGIDVDGIVEQLMTAEKAKKLTKLQQQVQTTEWTQEAYREIISDIQDFSSKYFDVTSSSSLLSSSSFLKYVASSSSSAVTATCASTATAKNHTIQVTQLATSATLTSSSSVSKTVQGSAVPDYLSLSDESFVMTLDGKSYSVDLDTVTGLSSLQTAIDTAVGSGKVTVSETDDGYLEITAADDGIQAISISATSTSDAGLSELFGSDPILSNRLTTTDTLATIASQLSSATELTFNTDGQIELTINGTTLTFDQDDTLAEMISKINKSDVGATMTYDSITGKLVLTADDTGAGNSLVVTEGSDSNFLSVLLQESTAGLDAKVTIDDQALTRSSNTITIDGVTYTLNQETTDKATVSVTQDTDGLYDLLSSFVEDYNTLIATINTAINENADSDYPPLTDDQKAEMTDDEIEAWEEKAKVGLLESDSTLKKLLSNLRTAVVDSVSGQSISLSSIGITSGTYDTKGTLYITESTLKAAIASDPEAIMDLFTQQATSTKTGTTTSIGTTAVLRSLTASELSTRYKEEGIAYRFYDILQKNVSSIRDNAGNKGTLLEKAGTEGDTTETDNTLSTLLDKYTEELEAEEDRLDEFEENLYTKYTALETYISSMNAQLSAIASLTSS
jgi:flagellar hook-associated protein 2